MSADVVSAVGTVLIQSTHKCMAAVEADASPRTGDTGRPYQPRSIEVTWKRDTAAPQWRCRWISIFGPQIRADGSLGTREVNETIWTESDGTPRSVSPESDRWPIPDWAIAFARDTCPAGGAS